MASIIPDGQLVYGMQLQVQAKSKTFVEEWEADAGAEELRAIVQKADETGFFYVAVCDHLAVTKPLDAHMQTTWYDTVATLGWIAGFTKNVRLLSHVYVMSYRHPLQTAKSFMTLDELSGGRAILGVGAGHLQGEFELLGLDYDGRGAVTDAGRRRDPGCVHRRVPRHRHAVLGPPEGRGDGAPPAPGAPPDLGGRLVEAGVAPCGRARRRLAAPGHAARRDAGADRVPPRAPQADAGRRPHRSGHDHRVPLRRHARIGTSASRR